MTLRIGVIGLGIAGRRHLAGYAGHPEVTVAGVSDVDAMRGSTVAAEFDAPFFLTAEALLQADLDAVSVCVPHARLVEVALQAASRGKHVLLEKPIATTLADGRRVVAACAERGVRLMVGFVHRFRDEVIWARQALRAGWVGRPYLVLDRGAKGGDARAPGWIWDPKLAGGGVMFYNGVHAVDRVRHLIGAEAQRVAAVCTALAHEGSLEDTVTATLQLRDGVLASLVQHFPSHPYGEPGETLVYGTEGVLVLRVGQSAEVHTGTRTESYSSRDDFRFVRQAEEFVAAITDRRSPTVNGEDGLAALAITEGIYASSRSGGRWIDVEGTAESQLRPTPAREAGSV